MAVLTIKSRNIKVDTYFYRLIGIQIPFTWGKIDFDQNKCRYTDIMYDKHMILLCLSQEFDERDIISCNRVFVCFLQISYDQVIDISGFYC
jgi:hypothetical protein